MRFHETPLAGAYVLEPEPREDERGLFARIYDRDEFAARGLDPAIAQCSVSWNRRKGTLRGLHYQAAPHEETKQVRAIRGSILDVIVDLRPGSPTLHRHFAVELSAANRLGLYVPKGFAHGFQTLEDDVEVLYQISTPHAPGSDRGVHHASALLGIRWPLPVSCIHERDAGLPALR
jgi:dTDP-4-dehydrorhamnose 3,5-epimerase